MSTNRIIQSALSLSIVTIMMGTAYAADSQENSSDKRSQSPELAKLQTIVVSAAGYEQDLTKAPASITVISKEELQKREYSDITDVLRNTPGVVVSGSGSAQGISIRGMSSNYTLFLIDGKRQYSKDVNPNADDYGFEKIFCRLWQQLSV